jgi:hypothetical protein
VEEKERESVDESRRRVHAHAILSPEALRTVRKLELK